MRLTAGVRGAPGAAVSGPAASPVAAVAVAAVGLGFLLLRPGLAAAGPVAGTAMLAAGYAGLGAAAGPLAARRAGGARAAPLGPVLPLAVGLGAVAVAAVTARPAAPLPAGATSISLGLLAAVAEEALFRGLLYGLLERLGRFGRFGAAPAVLLPAVAFALLHLPSYGLAALPVDLGAGLLFGWQRWASGRWTVPAATHAAANLLAVILR